MQTNKLRVRRDYAPLNISTSIVVQTPLSPLTQVYNSTLADSEYEPDRGITPTVIYPQIFTNAADGSWQNGISNDKISNIRWYEVDSSTGAKKDITELSAWSGLYSIQNDGSTQAGTLTVKRNIGQDDPKTLVFTCTLTDTRMNINHTITSDYVKLTTVDKSGDTYALTIDGSHYFRYNPIVDPLLIYEYECSLSGETVNETTRQAKEDDPLSYITSFKLNLFKGQEEQKLADFTVDLYYTNELDYTNLSKKSTITELVSFDLTEQVVKIDCRFVDSQTYTVLVRDGNAIIAQTQFTVKREIPAMSFETLNEATIRVQDIKRSDKLIARHRGRIVAHPELAYKITWMTDSDGATGVKFNEGTATEIKLSKTGIGQTESSFLDTYIDYDDKGIKKTAVDKDGNTYVNSSGDTYIYN